MRRRAFLTTLAVPLAGPLIGEAQQAGRVFRLGFLSPATLPASADGGPFHFFEGLRELGYVEGQNLLVERRYAGGRADRLPRLARELVQLQVDVIVAVASGVEAAQEATTTIPIVMAFGSDPVGRGFVASLGRPGGNITGVTYSEGPEIAAKRLEFIAEAVPRVGRIAVLGAGDTPQNLRQATQKAASSLGVKLSAVDIRGGDYDQAFGAMVAERPGALVVLGSAILNADRKRIIVLAAKHRLPAMYEWPEHVEEGGLMAYGASLRKLLRSVASFVDRLFKGANPSALPVERPTVFELAINLKAAGALGLTIPPSVLLRAAHVIE